MEQAESTLKKEEETVFLWLFDIALILKILNGALEILAAFLVLVITPHFVLRVAEFVTSGEIAQDPNDFFAMTIRNAAHAFAIQAHYFIALYLVLHGSVKLILAINIFRKKRIAYPLFMLALVCFGTYETYIGFVRQEILMSVLAVLDFLLIILTAHEYKRRYPAISTWYGM